MSSIRGEPRLSQTKAGTGRARYPRTFTLGPWNTHLFRNHHGRLAITGPLRPSGEAAGGPRESMAKRTRGVRELCL